MTQNQIQYQKNLIDQRHNLEQERIQDKSAEANIISSKAAQKNADTNRIKYIYTEAPYQLKKGYADNISAIGSFLRGLGSMVGGIFK